MLSTELEKSNCKTYHAPGDADLLIVQKAVQSATTSTTVLVGEDMTSLFCSATMQVSTPMASSEPKKSFTSRTSGHKKKKLGQDICYNIFIHAILGCDDITLRLYMGVER